MPADDLVVEAADRAFGDDGAAIHDVETVTDLEAEVEALFDEQNADASFGTNFPKGAADFGNSIP